MKVLLVRPVTPSHFRLNFSPPLGIGHLASALRRRGHEADFVDCALRRMDMDDFIEFAMKARPDAIGIQTYTHDVFLTQESCERLRTILPETTLVVGGAHISGTPETTFKDIPAAHFGFRGEADNGFVNLLESLPKNDAATLSKIPGLVWRRDGETIVNEPYLEEDLDSLYPLAWDLMPPKAYPESTQGVFFKRLPIGRTVVTRGCPCRCTFCAGHTVLGRRIRVRSVENVLEEIRTLKADYGVREMHFLDDNLTSKRDYANSLFEAFLSRNINMPWCCPNGLRLDSLDGELLGLMKRSGCYSISVGIESGAQSVLDATHKGLRLDMVEEKIRLIREQGLVACAFFILGFPMDTRKTIQETIRFALRIPLDRATFSTFLPLPGSEIVDEMRERGEIEEIDYSHIFQADIAYSPPGISKTELKNFQRASFLKFFLRPKIFWGVVSNLRTARQVVFLVRRAFIFFS